VSHVQDTCRAATLGATVAASRLAPAARQVITKKLVIAGTLITVLVAWELVDTLPLGVTEHEGSTVIVGHISLRPFAGRT
jgi:cation transport ATPase